MSKASFKVRLDRLIEDALSELSDCALAHNQYGSPRPGILKVTEITTETPKCIGVMMGHLIVQSAKKKASFIPFDEARKTLGLETLMRMADSASKSRETEQPVYCNVFTSDWEAELKRTGIL